jgi:hypothetical protein
MHRRVLCASVLVLSASFLVSFSTAQEPPRAARTMSVTWEYGVLETSQTGGGTAFVFCRFTAEGCAESVLGVRPFPPARATSTPSGARQGAYEAFAASAIAALGRDGWELVTETAFGAYSGAAAPVLLFKRPVR